MIVYGLEEVGLTDQQLLDLYNRLTPTERKYYECWTYWKRFKIQPWRYLNQKIITRDLVLMLSQIDGMYHERMQKKQMKDRVMQDQAAFRPFQQQQQGSGRSNKVQSVL